MGDHFTYTGLGVVVRERPDSGYHEFGVMLDGVYVPFAAVKSGQFAPEVEAAKAAAAAGASSSTADAPAS